MIAIIDTGGANLTSIRYAFARLGCESVVTTDPTVIASASHVILPGVGHAAYVMQKIMDEGLRDFIPQLTQPVLGICLGMQILYEFSEESEAECLGILPGTVARIPARPDFPIPHMGWSPLTIHYSNSTLLRGLHQNEHVYFAHSYQVPMSPEVGASVAGSQIIPAVVEQKNFRGVQFHPERSSRTGARILQNFLEGSPS